MTVQAQTNITFDFENNLTPNDGSAAATVYQLKDGETLQIASTGGAFLYDTEINMIGSDVGYLDGTMAGFDYAVSPNSTRIRISLVSGNIFNLNTISIYDYMLNSHSGNSITLVSSDGTVYDVGANITYTPDYGGLQVDVSAVNGFKGITYFDVYANNANMQLILDNIYLTNITAAPTATAPALGDGSVGSPYQIASLENLTWLANQVNAGNAFDGKYFIQTADIDASSTSTWYVGKGWMPIGYASDGGFTTYYEFKGNYNGQNHTISGITINRTGIACYGLFGFINNSTIENLGVTNISITATGNNDQYLGGLAAFVYVGCTIDNCYATGSVNGRWQVGGLIASSGEDGNTPNIIKNSYSQCNVTSSYWVGGGLISESRNDTITNCYSTGTVTAQGACTYVGGLMGTSSSTVNNCYSSSPVTAGTGENIGGLIGENSGIISNCYSTGFVNSTGPKVGGLVGGNTNSGTVNNSYSVGAVTGTTNTGGLVGYNTGTPAVNVTNSFWDTETSGQAAGPGGGTGKTTEEMKTVGTFTNAGWDFVNESANGNNDTWRIEDTYNNGYPVFAQGLPATPDMAVLGNGNLIADGSVSTSAANFTDFASKSTAAGSVVRAFTIVNNGTAALTFSDASPYVTISGANAADFSVSVAPAASLAPGATSTFGILFDPSADGVRTATISIASNDPNENPYTFNIVGTGISLPTVTTQAASAIGTDASTANGNITSLGYPNPTAYGFVWGTALNPTTANNVIDKGAAGTTGTFTSALAGLSENTTYHIRAFATNTSGTVYGDDVSFTTLAPPVLANIEGTAIAYTENDAATAVTGALTVSDADNTNLEGAIIQISANYQNGQDVIGFTAQNGITGSWDAGTGTLTLTGTSAIANYQAALRSITYNNTSENPSELARTVSITVNDSSLTSNIVTRTINVTRVNDAPVNNVPGAQTVDMDHNLVFSSLNGNQITFTDDYMNTFEITLSVTNGALTLGSTTGLTFTTGDGTSDASMKFSGGLADLMSAVGAITYVPTTGFYGNSLLIITTDDQGNIGTGGAKSDTDSIAISVTPPLPAVNRVTSSTANGTYKTSDVIDVMVEFNQALIVAGTPQLTLETGTTDRVINYVSGSGSSNLHFSYTVLAGELSSDLDYKSTTALALNGGTIKNQGNIDANLTLPAVGSANSLGGQKAIVVDGVAPYITSVSVPSNGTYITGQNLDFTVNFNEAVTLSDNSSYLALTIGAVSKNAGYISGSGTNAVVYRYTVAANDLDTDGIGIGSSLNTGTGTIKDAAGNNLNTTLNSVASTASVLVDAVAPAVTSVSVPSNGIYPKDGVLDFTVNFGENVIINTGGGTPYILVTIGGTGRTAAYTSGSGTNEIVFRYTVPENDTDNDGIAVGASATLNGGTIKDAAGNNAVLTLNSVGVTSLVLVDGVLPVVQSVSVPANGTYKSNQNLDFTVIASENIAVDTTAGKPRIAVAIGAATRYAYYYSGSGNDSVVFRYTIIPGEVDANGITVGALTLNSGTIKDLAGNSMVLTLNSVGSTAAVLVDATNEAPVLAAIENAGLNYTEGAGAVNITSSLTVTDGNDTDIEGAVVQIAGNYQSAEDILSFVYQNGITGSWNTGTGTLTLSGTATLANYQAALRSIKYTNSSSNPAGLARTISYTVNDGEDNSNTITRTISILPVNNSPELSINTAVLQYTEGSGAKVVAELLNANDVDNTSFAGAVIEISGNYRPGEDQLSFENQNEIKSTWDSSVGILSLSGNSTVANYLTALRNIKYLNTSADPDTVQRTVSFTVNDGNSSSNIAERKIIVVPVNNAPVVNNIDTTTVHYTDGGNAVSLLDTIIISDPDNTVLYGAEVSVSGNYRTGEDRLKFEDQNGITGNWDGSSGILSLSGAAPFPNYLSALRSVRYTNMSANPDTVQRTVSFVVNDGASRSIPVSRVITISAVNYAPELSQVETEIMIYTEGEGAKPVTASLFADDKDYTNMAGAVAEVTGNYRLDEDVLGFTNQDRITGAWDETSGRISFSGSATLAEYQSALRSVTYTNKSANPDTVLRTISFIINDGTINSNTITRRIKVISINGAPVLAGIETGVIAYTEKDPAVQVSGTITISDEEDSVLTGALVKISGNYAKGEDVLSFVNNYGIAGNWNAETGTMNLSGTVSLAAYEKALRDVKYYNTSVTPSVDERTISIVVSDGTGTSNTLSRIITISAVEGAPVLTGIESTTLNYYEGTDTSAVTSTLTINDINSTYLYSAAVQVTKGYHPAEDSLALAGSPAISVTWLTAEGKLNLSGKATVEEYQYALRRIKYVNKSSNPSTEIRTVSFTVKDEEEQSSVVTRSIQILITNNPPVLAKNTGINVMEGESVVISNSVLLAEDADNSASEITYTVTALPEHGRLSINGTEAKPNSTFTQNFVDNNKVVYIHDSSETTSDIFKFTLKDPSETSGEFSFVIAVIPVNDRPVLSAIPNISLKENESIETDLSSYVEDADNSIDQLTGTLTSLTGQVIITHKAGLKYVFSPVKDWYGTDTIKVIISDGSLTAEGRIRVTVTHINRNPEFVDMPDTVKYNEGEGTEINLGGKILDAETPVSGLTVELSADAEWLKYSYSNETQIIQLSSETGYSGECELTIKVKDNDGGENSAKIKVIVSLISGVKMLDGMPAVFALSQNYPNPFNPSTKIRYSIPEAGEVSLKVYTALGEEVSELVRGYFNAGTYEVNFNANELSSGLYIIRLTAGDYTQLRKMMLLK